MKRKGRRCSETATTKEYRDYIAENLERAGDVRFRPMMGEYCVYIRDRVAGLLCDNSLFLKDTPSMAALLPEAETAYPYEGSRTLMRIVPDVEDVPRMAEILAVLYEELPEAKPKRKKRV